MIDLHMHTTYSDGTDNCEELLKRAEEKKLSFISITDHNNCKVYEELKNTDVRKNYSGTIIPGIELNTKILKYPIEVLGYGIDTDYINKNISKFYIDKEKRNILEVKKLYEICVKNGIEVGKNFVENYKPNIYASTYLHGIITKSDMNKNIIEEDAWNNSNIFYRKYVSNPNTLFYVDLGEFVPDFTTVTNLIKEAGGLIFIPHIFEYRENAYEILNYIISNYKIDGIECFYTTFSVEQTEFLISVCKENNLFVSGGSDYHGTFKPNLDMGSGFGNLKIDESIIAKWKDLVMK